MQEFWIFVAPSHLFLRLEWYVCRVGELLRIEYARYETALIFCRASDGGDGAC